MFDIFGGGAASLRRLREEMDSSMREPQGMWTYPVVREKCSCGASTETVLFDDERAEKFFSKWRKEHGCSVRDKASV